MGDADPEKELQLDFWKTLGVAADTLASGLRPREGETPARETKPAKKWRIVPARFGNRHIVQKE